ncbi:MAG: cytokinesis protein 3 [Peltula sp. TS41687]|nr:MAG: cytokinesis protein 3 [Peltula sp. TS41687]
MVPAPPELPMHFPCWCRAVYSWGGETKRDLGFVEGDLIQCLNAGDGSWWTGRLWRDKRMVGLFPSNFVQVLDDNFRPASRTTSPMSGSQNGAGSRGPSPQPGKSVSKSYRKPFQAYARAGSPNPAAVTRTLGGSTQTSMSEPSGYMQPISRSASRNSMLEPIRSHSPRPPSSRAPSPGVFSAYRPHSRSPSPYGDIGSSPPPPPPPPHRVQYTPRAAPSPTPSIRGRHTDGYSMSRQPSPQPTSSNAMGQTPSPLRDAMEDVMTSLHGMSLHQDTPSQQRPGSAQCQYPWSPDTYEQVPIHSSRRRTRPRSSLGIAGLAEDVQDLNDPYTYSENDDGIYNQYPEANNSAQGQPDELFLSVSNVDGGLSQRPTSSSNSSSYYARPHSVLGRQGPGKGSTDSAKSSKKRKSTYTIGVETLGRTFTTKSTTTNASSGVQSASTEWSASTQITVPSIMSGHSAGGFSATSAGSLARKRLPDNSITQRMSMIEREPARATESSSGSGIARPRLPASGVTYHSSNDPQLGTSVRSGWSGGTGAQSGPDGASRFIKPKKSGFFKKMLDSAKTGAASARMSIAAGQPTPPASPQKTLIPNGVTSIAGGSVSKGSGVGGSSIDWVQVRRDVNRSNSLSMNEKVERQERCQMMDIPVIKPVEALYELASGDEGVDGHPISQPTDFQAVNLGLVDRGARFVNSLPPMANPTSLAQGYVCRPYKSDAQRLRAIFTWVSEKIAWEEDFEGKIEAKRVIQTRKGCAEEVTVLVAEMCSAVGIYAEVVRGYLKAPGEIFDTRGIPAPNHWWNAVLVDGEWRMMDCSLASPTNPKRAQYSSAGSQQAENWWYLTRPMEICYTHVPMIPEQQHICPPAPYEVLLALPCACPPYFKDGLQLLDFDTSQTRIEDLELVQIQFSVPSNIECLAEVEVKAFQRDADGDFFESGEVAKKRALAQADWVRGLKRYTIKALLPGDEGHGVLKVYAGKRGLLHSIKYNPHSLAFALPIIHTGSNPPYEFLTRHPTPHAQRHDLYVVQPQCSRLAINNTFVFAVRQHPASLTSSLSSEPPPTSPTPFARPSSAMSMSTNTSSLGSGQGYAASQQKPAKLAIQAPSGKILRLMRKSEHTISTSGPGGGEAGDGGVWETIIKCGERGVWRGLVLADRSARWCVFAEWTCV